MQTWRRINHFKLVLQMGHTRNFSSSNAAFLRRGTGLYDPRGILRVEQNFRNYFQWLFYCITRSSVPFLVFASPKYCVRWINNKTVVFTAGWARPS